MMLALPRIKREAVETRVKSSKVLDKEPLMDSLAVLDTVTGSNVMLALAVIGGVPETPVAAKVNESNVILAFPRIKRDAVETSVKSSSVLDKEPLMDSLAVLDTVKGSNVMLALAVIGGLPKTPVAVNVKESNVMLALDRIKRDAVETSVKEFRVMLALAVMPEDTVDAIRGNLTLNMVNHQLRSVGLNKGC
jgi:hypothetical protein